MIQKAHDEYNSGNFALALELYKELASQNNAEAITSLGFMYQNAKSCQKDDAKAIELYEKASLLGHPLASFYLAIAYMNGSSGVAHDQFKSHELYMHAAVNEIVPAMYEVALMLERGLGCLQNFSEAAFWYEEGAKRGHLESFNNLGVLFKDGHGVVQDEAKCFICFSRAAEGGLPEGLYNLGQLYDQGIGCEIDHEKALEYCRNAAFKGHAKAKEIIKKLQEDGQILF